MREPRPAPVSTITSKPSPTRRFTLSEEAPTRASEAATSRGMQMVCPTAGSFRLAYYLARSGGDPLGGGPRVEGTRSSAQDVGADDEGKQEDNKAGNGSTCKKAERHADQDGGT